MASFVSGSYSFRFPAGRLLPYKDNIQFNQKRYLTEDNKPKIYQTLGKSIIFNLNFSNLTRSEMDEMMTFFKDISYSSSEITFEDDIGFEWDCRLWQDSIDINRKLNLKYDVSLVLFADLADSDTGIQS